MLLFFEISNGRHISKSLPNVLILTQHVPLTLYFIKQFTLGRYLKNSKNFRGEMMLEMLVAHTYLLKNRKSATFMLQGIYFWNPHMLGYQMIYYLALAN